MNAVLRALEELALLRRQPGIGEPLAQEPRTRA